MSDLLSMFQEIIRTWVIGVILLITGIIFISIGEILVGCLIILAVPVVMSLLAWLKISRGDDTSWGGCG